MTNFKEMFLASIIFGVGLLYRFLLAEQEYVFEIALSFRHAVLMKISITHIQRLR